MFYYTSLWCIRIWLCLLHKGYIWYCFLHDCCRIALFKIPPDMIYCYLIFFHYTSGWARTQRCQTLTIGTVCWMIWLWISLSIGRFKDGNSKFKKKIRHDMPPKIFLLLLTKSTYLVKATDSIWATGLAALHGQTSYVL